MLVMAINHDAADAVVIDSGYEEVGLLCHCNNEFDNER